MVVFSLTWLWKPGKSSLGMRLLIWALATFRLKHCVWEINQKQEPITVRRSYFLILRMGKSRGLFRMRDKDPR